jgi:hypothetical protein
MDSKRRRSFAGIMTAWPGVPPMLRTCSCGVAFTAMVALSTMAQAADETALTLACQGTVTTKVFGGRFVDYEPEPVSMGLIVNFTARTVRGLYLFDDLLPITELNEGTVVFEGFSKFLGMDITGFMGRVTGNVGMLATTKENAYDYELKCRPAQRMF